MSNRTCLFGGFRNNIIVACFMVFGLASCAPAGQAVKKGRAGSNDPRPEYFSAILVPRPSQLPPSNEKPSLHLEGESHRIYLNWSRVPGALLYKVYSGPTMNVSTTRANLVGESITRKLWHNNLIDSRRYYYKVVPFDMKGKAIGPNLEGSFIPYPYAEKQYKDFIKIIIRPDHVRYNDIAREYLNDADKGWLIEEFNGNKPLQPLDTVIIPKREYFVGGLNPSGYQTIPILTYHHLSADGKSTRMFVPLSNFERQMKFLNDNGYKVITLDEYVRFMEFSGQVPDKAVVITFDDGWRDIYTLAYPVLKRYGFKATLFVYTDLVGNHENDKTALDWDEIREMKKSGVIDIQCHTKSHRNLKMSRQEKPNAYVKALIEELTISRDKIYQEVGGEPCKYLAYPFGATNHLVVAIAKKLGYRAAFTVRRGANPFFVTNHRVLRSMIFGRYSVQQFEKNLDLSSDRVLK